MGKFIRYGDGGDQVYASSDTSRSASTFDLSQPKQKQESEYEVKDSGQRQQFPTGAQRDTQIGKGRPELLSPYAIMRVALVAERGAWKYGDRNWEHGMPLSRFIQSAERHIQQLKMGQSDEDHAAHAAWNLLAYMHVQTMINRGVLGRELDDMPNYEQLMRMAGQAVQKELENKLSRIEKGQAALKDS